MRRAERLFRLVNEMRLRGVSRAEDLAAHFEISVRTVYRDIAHLQASGVPIEGEAGVGYLLRPGFDLPNMTFTYDQIDALAIGLSFVENAGDPILASAAQEVRDKLQAVMPKPENEMLRQAPYYSFSQSNFASPFTAQIRIAIREKLPLQICYEDQKAVISYRKVNPLALWFFKTGAMFGAWCTLRNDFRTFCIERIHTLQSIDEPFLLKEGQDLRAFIAYQCEGS